MKKIISIFVIFLIVSSVDGQILTNSTPGASISNSNAFLDASTNYSYAGYDYTDFNKGLVFPDVNLVSFQFENTVANGAVFPSYYDGMVVYNNGTGNTLTTGNRPSTSTVVEPGFYYFYNPNGASNGNVTAGVWTPLGSGAKNYTTTPIKTNTSIDGAQVWAVKGSFIASGTSALVSVTMPAGMTGYYKMTTYQGGKTFRSDISEFKMITTVLNTDNVVTGNGLFSEVYPAGNYDYTLEYFQ